MFKKSFRNLLILTLAAVTTFPLVPAKAAPQPGQPTEFGIFMWGAIPGSVPTLKRAKEAGMTIAGFATPQQLNMVQEAGLTAFVWPSEAEMEAAIKDKNVASHPAFAGNVIDSEFSTKKFPEVAKFVALSKQENPTKIPLICMFPTIAGPEALGAKTYEEYLDKYIAEVKPSLLCYDEYAFMEDGTVDRSYYDCLEIYRTKSLQHGIPFWPVIQGNGHMHYRVPTTADILYQCYSSVAYGATGFGYFTYHAYAVGNYRGAAIDQFGNETPTWSNVANANRQILTLAPTLMKLTSTEVYHIGGEIPAASHGPSGTSLVRDIAGNVLIGDFVHEDGSRYVMIVNKDLQKSLQLWPKFRDPNVIGADKVSSYRENHIFTFDNNYEERFLAPGQGMLLKLKTK